MKVRAATTWQHTAAGNNILNVPQGDAGESAIKNQPQDGTQGKAEPETHTGSATSSQGQAENLAAGQTQENSPIDIDEIQAELEQQLTLFQSLQKQSGGKSKSNSVTASAPTDSVGQLASMLARARTPIDVRQVASKAERALANLRTASVSCSDSDKDKIAQMIRRMKTLIKRIHKKLSQLNKEEQMERRIQKAEKEMAAERAKQLREELRIKRKRRRREEENYARKEMGEDMKESAAEMTQALCAGQMGVTNVPGADASLQAAAGNTGNYAAAAASYGNVSGVSLSEGVSIDTAI